MAAGLAMAAGLGTLAGGVIRAIDEAGPSYNGGYTRAVLANPFASPSARAGAESADRIAGVSSDPLADALARAEEMRRRQRQDMFGTHSIAMGGRSLAREQGALEQQRMRQAIQGEAAGARGSYAQLQGQRAAPVQSSLIGARMVAPTEALARQQQMAAMDQYATALSGMSQPDAAQYENYRRQQQDRRQGLLSGEETKIYGTGQATTDQEQRAKDRHNQQIYA